MWLHSLCLSRPNVWLGPFYTWCESCWKVLHSWNMCVYFPGLSSAFGLFGSVWGFCLSIWVEIALIRNVRTVYWSSKKKKENTKIQSVLCFAHQFVWLTNHRCNGIECGTNWKTTFVLWLRKLRHTCVCTTPLFQIEQQLWYNGHHYILTVDKPQVQILEFVDLIFTMLATFFVGFVAFDLP